MVTIHTLRKKIRQQEYEFAIPHFFEEMVNDNLTFNDIKKALANGRISRRFTRDLRGTRYEITGFCTRRREIGIICRIKATGKLLFITAYLLK